MSSLTILSNSLRATYWTRFYLKKSYHEMSWCTSDYLMKEWCRILFCYNSTKTISKAKWRKTQCKNCLYKRKYWHSYNFSTNTWHNTPLHQIFFRHIHSDLRKFCNLSIIILSKRDLHWSESRKRFMRVIEREKKEEKRSTLTTKVFWKMVERGISKDGGMIWSQIDIFKSSLQSIII